MQIIAYLIKVSIEGTIMYVSYYGFCGIWYVLLTPYAGG